MNKTLASEIGFLGINVDSNFDLAWLKTEVINKLEQGDKMSVYKLLNFARHNDDPKIVKYATDMLELHKDLVEDYVLDH